MSTSGEELTPDQLENQRRTLHRTLGFVAVMDAVVAIVAFATGVPIVGVIVIVMAVIGTPVCWRIFDRQIDERIRQVSGPQPL